MHKTRQPPTHVVFYLLVLIFSEGSVGHLNRARCIFPLNLTESGVLKRAYEILMWNCLPCDSAVFTTQQSGLRGLAYTIAVTKEQQLIRVRRGGDKTVKACCWLWASSQQMQTKGFVTRITLPLSHSLFLCLSLSFQGKQSRGSKIPIPFSP